MAGCRVSEVGTRVKVAWFKENRARFDRGVASCIYVGTDPVLRTRMAADIARTAAMFDHCRLAVAASDEEARSLAETVLAATA